MERGRGGNVVQDFGCRDGGTEEMSEKWKVEESGTWYYVKDDDDRLIHFSTEKTEVGRKIAHLVAAAPEMLELLKVCRKGIRAIMEDDRFGDYWDLFDELGRVIAMAEGEEQ